MKKENIFDLFEQQHKEDQKKEPERIRGEVTPEGWSCSVHLPLSYFRILGIDIFNCSLAATCILNSPDYLFLTTSDDQSGEPDFHRPWSWAIARVMGE
jgi:hypothetical protein